MLKVFCTISPPVHAIKTAEIAEMRATLANLKSTYETLRPLRGPDSVGYINPETLTPFANLGGWIQTIKEVRERTNCSLGEAKDTVDSWYDNGEITFPKFLGPSRAPRYTIPCPHGGVFRGETCHKCNQYVE